MDEITNTNPKIGTVQPHATAYWYQNPGTAALAATPDAMWTPHLMHGDVRHMQHGLVDMNGDGFPEFYGSCKSCDTTKGYYQGDPAALENESERAFYVPPGLGLRHVPVRGHRLAARHWRGRHQRRRQA